MSAFQKVVLPAFVISLAVAGASAFTSSRSTPVPAPSSAPRAAEPTDASWGKVAKRAMPSVVSVNSVKALDAETLAELGGPSGLPPGGGMPGSNHPYLMGVGSGIIIRGDGLILTNNHVVENASKVTVTLDEKTKVPARIIGTDDKTDLAVIKIDLKPGQGPLPAIGFGNSEQMNVGDSVAAIGSPFGLGQSVTSGIVSAKGRGRMGILDIEDFIQTDAAINPGNSGGPLLNTQGELIGVNTAIFSQSGGYTGVGFAIPARIASEVTSEIIKSGRVRRGWIGVAAQDLDPTLGKYFKSPDGQGALVSQVNPAGPASKSDLRTGDLVRAFDHQKVADAGQFKSLVGKSKAGARIPVEIVRDGKPKTVDLMIGEQPKPKAQMAAMIAKSDPAARKPIGITVEDIPGEIAKLLDRPKHTGAIVVDIEPGGAAFDAGLMPGDIVESVNQVKIDGPKKFNELTRKKDVDSIVLYIQRGKEEKIFVPVTMKAEGT